MRIELKIGIACAGMLAILAGIFVRPYEGSFIIVTENSVYDFIGPMQVAFTRATRTCHTVSSLAPLSVEWERVKARLSEVGSRSPASPRQMLRQGAWYLAQSEFELSEPGVVLFEQTPGGLIDRAEWGGTVAPFRDEPAIWDYLHKTALRAPNSLIQCFEPK
jgi:hypothetical protein